LNNKLQKYKHMKICILNVDNQNSNSAISKFEPLADPAPWLTSHNFERHFLSTANFRNQINGLLTKDFDVFLNLCDGSKGEDRPGIEVVKMLEKAGVHFTGAGSEFYEPSRQEMKDACSRANIKFPKGKVLNSTQNLINEILEIKFPMIVKHPNSYNSIGMTKKSVVCNFHELKTQTDKIIFDFESTLIEEYIEGKEFTALVIENPENNKKPIVFQPMEIIFPAGETFKHFDLKWKNHTNMKYVIINDKTVKKKIQKDSSTMFSVMNGKGYARCDMRMNAQGELFMLEINPNCSIYFPKNDTSSADEILFSEPDGHKQFTDLILKTALKKTY